MENKEGTLTSAQITELEQVMKRRGGLGDRNRKIREKLEEFGLDKATQDAIMRDLKKGRREADTFKDTLSPKEQLNLARNTRTFDRVDRDYMGAALDQYGGKEAQSLEAQKILAKGQATAQAQTNAVDTNADTSAVTVAAAGAQIEASSIGNQAIVNAIGEGNQVLASILSQIQGEFAKLPGYEG